MITKALQEREELPVRGSCGEGTYTMQRTTRIEVPQHGEQGQARRTSHVVSKADLLVEQIRDEASRAVSGGHRLDERVQPDVDVGSLRAYAKPEEIEHEHHGVASRDRPAARGIQGGDGPIVADDEVARDKVAVLNHCRGVVAFERRELTSMPRRDVWRQTRRELLHGTMCLSQGSRKRIEVRTPPWTSRDQR